MSPEAFIPVNEPLLDGNEKKYLAECIETGWISSEGPFVTKFEQSFASNVCRSHGIAVTNGTAALDAAIEALEIGQGDEVILPAFTIISCITQILRAGAKPVFVDCDPDTWTMNTSQIESKISKQTKAILVVHIYGLPADLDPILDLASKHSLYVIEDAAEAHGQAYKGKPCGSFGDISTFSFYPNKHVTTGEGGMILCDDSALAETCRSLRNLCFQPDRRFVHERIGWNLRMTNLQAAVGMAQLERLTAFVARKKRMGERYTSQLKDLKMLQLPVAATNYAENVYWVFGIVLRDDCRLDAAAAMRYLAEQGIGTRPFFFPLHQQPVLQRLGIAADERLPVSERLAERGFYVPSGMALRDEQIDFVARKLREMLQ